METIKIDENSAYVAAVKDGDKIKTGDNNLSPLERLGLCLFLIHGIFEDITKDKEEVNEYATKQ